MSSRPTVAVIDSAALKHNLDELKKKVDHGVKFMPVVKANGYGHGYLEVARPLQDYGCEGLGVAYTEEGVILREGGIKTRIYVLSGPLPGDEEAIVANDLTPIVFDSDTAHRLNQASEKAGKKTKIHVKVDTGMGRLGILPPHVVRFFQDLKNYPSLEFEGMLSHLAEAESEDKKFTTRQTETFLKAIEVIQGLGFEPPLIHMANSAAIVDSIQAHFNMVRPGIMVYGALPDPRYAGKLDLRPVMTLKSAVMLLKKVPLGYSISYGRTFIASRPSVIATLPIGYGDGLSRSLSGQAEVLIRGTRAPIVGTICMDHCMVDVTDVPGTSLGDEAVLIGAQGEQRITVDEIAEKLKTIPYEVLCSVSARVRREVV